MLTLQAVVSVNSPTGPVVGCRHPGADAIASAGTLRDVPGYHPAYYSEPLPLPPRVSRADPHLGRIVWPCWGLTRYAVGHVLMDSEALAQLEAVAEFDGRVLVSLINADEITHTLRMRIVARRPLADGREEDAEAVGPDDAEAGAVPWVVTLVDQRHDAAGKVYNPASPDPTTGTPATWGGLISELLKAAGYTVAAADIDLLVRTNIPDPSADWWERPKLVGRCACVLADAAAAAVGLRISVDGSGAVVVQDPEAARDAFDAWWETYGPDQGGGGRYDADRERPKTVTACPSGGSPVSTTLTAGLRGDLSIDVQPGDATDYADAMTGLVNEWLELDPAFAGFRGHVPVPASSLAAVVVFDTDDNTTVLERDPVHYPWPLAGSGPVGGGGIITGNVHDSETEDSTTAVLRFDEATGVRVDKGATAGDPDVVSLTFGKSITFVTKVCFATQQYETRTVTLPDGAVIGSPVCQDEPASCCPATVEVECCGDPIPEVLFLTISGGGGSYPMTYDAGTWTTGVVTVPGCGTFSFRLFCIGAGMYLGNNIFDSRACNVSIGGAMTVSGCGGGGFTSATVTGTVADVSGCACVGVTRTFTVTP